MKSNYKKLGSFIRQVDNRNSDLTITNLQGVSITKEFVPSIANIIGTDLSTYKVVRTGQFAYGPVTSRNGDKVSIALLKGEDCIISVSYISFEVSKPDELLPEYLMLWFMRPEFDRYARFMSNGSAREVFDWNCMCDVELPIPSIEKQHKVVHDYQIITDRIKLLQRLNDKLRELISTEFNNKIRCVNNSDEELISSELGTYPASWEVKPLGSVLSTIIDHRGITPSKLGGEWSREGVIALSARSVKNHELINLDIANRVDWNLYNRWMPEKLRPHDILMTSEAPLGEFYYVADYAEYCLSQRLFALRANDAIIAPTVLYFQLTDQVGLHQIDIRKTGTTVTGIRQSELVKIPIVLPKLSVQESFARFCEPVMLKIEHNARECRLLQKIQSLLLYKGAGNVFI